MNVAKIEETGFKSIFMKSGWKTISIYTNGQISRQYNYFENDLRNDKSFIYFNSNSFKKIKEIDNINNHYKIQITYFDKEERIEKSLYFLENDILNWYKKDTLFNYYPFDKIRSFYSKHNSNMDSTCFEFKYDNERITQILLFENCKKLTKKVMFQYNSKGFAVRQTIDYLDRDAIITGAKSENGVQRFNYIYDKYGNWIKRFYITPNGRRVLNRKRKIIYR